MARHTSNTNVSNLPETDSEMTTEVTIILNEDVYQTLILVCIVLLSAISLSGTVFNMINIIIFNLVGIRDSPTVCFFCLSLVDLGVCLILNYLGISVICSYAGISLPTSAFSINFLLINTVYSFSSDMAAAITTFIGIQRGLCVVFPFYTRNAFTRNRSLATIGAIFTFVLICSLPRLTSLRLKRSLIPGTNNSILALYETDTWEVTDAFFNIFVKTIIFFAEFIILFICLIAFIRGMRSSRRLKKESSSAYSNAPESNLQQQRDINVTNNGNKEISVDNDAKVTKTKPKTEKVKGLKESKESRAVKQYAIIVFVHLSCTFPRMALFAYTFYNPSFNSTVRYFRLFNLFSFLMNLTDSINSTVNFFIYLTFNSTFKRKAASLLCQ